LSENLLDRVFKISQYIKDDEFDVQNQEFRRDPWTMDPLPELYVSSEKLNRGSRLENGDKIVTGKNSFAAIRYIDDKSTVRIRSNSTCIIRGKKEQNKILKNVYLEVGTIFARVTEQRGRFEISTPTSVASVKGSEAIIDQELKGATYYYGEEGVWDITNDGGTALLRAGETAFVKSKKDAPVVRKTRPGEKPKFEEDEGTEDNFEFEFENESGTKKSLKFKASKND